MNIPPSPKCHLLSSYSLCLQRERNILSFEHPSVLLFCFDSIPLRGRSMLCCPSITQTLSILEHRTVEWSVIFLVIRSVSDVLRPQSRFVKVLGVRPQAESPTHFTNLLWVRTMSVTDLITNLSRRQPLFSR